MMNNTKNFIAVAVLLALVSTVASAAEVELRLVAHDRVETTVDKLERRRDIVNPVSTGRGVEMQKVGLDLVCWARNVLLDGKPVFERYYEGKYVDRLPVARAELQPGDHVIWPGNHVINVAQDGTVTSKSPEVVVQARVVFIKCYPVEIHAYRANPEQGDLPMSMRAIPLPDLTIREAGNVEEAESKAKPGEKAKPLELMPLFDKFAALTVWLPANTVGKGYYVHPVGLTFHLGADGLKVGAGGGSEVQGLHVRGGLVEIPLHGYPIVGAAGTKVVVSGVEDFTWSSHNDGARQLMNLYPRSKPYDLRVSEFGPGIVIEGDVSAYPEKSICVELADRIKATQRILVAETATRHLTPGGVLKARVRAVDATTAMQAAQAAKAGGQTPEAIQTAVAGMNPLADAAVFAGLQPYEGGQWTELKVEPARAGEVQVSIPRAPDGLYRLQLGVRCPDGRPLLTSEWVSIVADKNAPGIGVFTHRGRDAFFRGEPFYINVAVLAGKQPVPAGVTVEAALADAAGHTLPLLSHKTSAAIAERETFIVRMDGQTSLSLAPGRYRVEAKLGGRAGRPLALDIIEPDPATHFTNMLNGKYNPFGDHYTRVLRTCEDAELVAREIADAGYNTFMGMSYDVARVNRQGLEIEQVIREMPALGPWEAYYQPSGRDRFMNAAVRNNLRFYENIFSYHDTMLPREPRILDACERYATLETASMQHSPAFKGVCLYDEFYASSESDTSASMIATFYKAEEMTFRERHGGLSSAEAKKALDRFVGRPAAQRRYEDLEKFRQWPAHEDWEWQTFSDRMAAAVKGVMPTSQNFTLQRFWGSNGGNIAPNGTPSGVFRSLDAASCVMYKDGGVGDRPVFAPMQADVLRVRDDMPVWTQLHSFGAPGLFGQHLLRQAFFGLSQKTEGFNFFTVHFDYKSPQQLDNRETVRDIAQRLCTPYGDLLMACEKGYKKVGIYYSRTADFVHSRKPNNLSCTCEGLWVACVRAGFPADFLYDEQIRAGAGMQYDVVFAPGFYYEDECPPDILAALKRLVNAGKTVAVERSSKLPVEGIVRLDSELDEYDDKLGGAFPRYVDFESEMVWDRTEDTTGLVREFLSKRIEPAAIHDLLVGPDWLKCRSAQYMVVANFAFTRFTGTYKTLYQAPDAPTLRFPKRPPVCYDVLEMKRVDVGTESEMMTLKANLKDYPGKIYAFLPADPQRLSLHASPKVEAGANMNYRVALLDARGGTIDAGFPIEIAISDAKGAVLYHVYRAAAPELTGAWRVPVNAAPGAWRLRARDLMTGLVSEAAVEVSAGKFAGGALDTRRVWMRDAQHVRSFLSGADELVIAVDEEQPWVQRHAEKLAQALMQRGRKVKVARVADVLRLPQDWNREMPTIDGARLWRGDVVMPGLFVDAPVILFGRRFENRLIEGLIQRDVLPEPLTSDFPGPGKAVVNWVRRAFSNEHDAVLVLSCDDEGLARGVEALLEPDRQGAAEPASPKLVTPALDAATASKEAVSRDREPSSYRDMLSSEDIVRSLDVDQASGRVLAGTFGYGFNLFCFGADGKLLWKQFLPEHHVYFARWYDEGRRVVAATARGYFVFLLDGATGAVLKKFASTEWPRYHGGYNEHMEGAVETEVPIVLNPALRQIVITGLTGVVAVDYDGKKMWTRDRAPAVAAYPKEAIQLGGASFPCTLVPGNAAVSPDGARLAHGEFQVSGSTQHGDDILTVWSYRPMILDARTGAVLAANEKDPGSETYAGGWWVSWLAGSELPLVNHGAFQAPLGIDGQTGEWREVRGQPLKDGGALVCRQTTAERLDKDARTLWRAEFDTICLPELDCLNAAQTRLYRCDRDGLVRCVDMTDGRVKFECRLPFSARLCTAGDEVVAGAVNGSLARLSADGKPLWSTRIRDHNQKPDRDYAGYIHLALLRDADSTEELFPVSKDRPGDYDAILRMGLEQVANGGFESGAGWACARGELTLTGPARSGQKALSLADGQRVTQRLNRKIIPSATYLLEFFYRVDAPQTTLVAGAMLGGKRETLTAARFEARAGEWTFARLAVKTMAETATLDVGFEAAGGRVLVDDVSLKPVRFPSANLLATPDLHAVEPTFVRDIRVQYDRIPSNLRDKLRGQSHVVAFPQGVPSTAVIYTEEQAFLHNGWLDDVGQMWTYQPDNIGFSIVLSRPSWVSHLVLYLNNATPDNVYETIAILANNMETKLPEEVALVRCNRRRFVIVHFAKAIYTDCLKVLPGPHRAHHDCLTEVEVYGPLGGPETAVGTRGFTADPLATPMLMGAPSHTPKTLAPDLTGQYAEAMQVRVGPPAYLAGGTVADGVFTFGQAAGHIASVLLPGVPRKDERNPWGPTWRLETVTPTTTPARYAGRMLVGSADYKLHAIADNGMHLWAFSTGGRVYSPPTPAGDEVYFGSDDGRLYKVDVDSGMLIWEFQTGGRIRAAPALDEGRVFAVSWDGNLYAVDAATGNPVWKAPVAACTRSSPALRAARLYLGTEDGQMLCFDARSGAPVWKQALGGYISCCPVVTDDGVVFASEQGNLALVAHDGRLVWSRSVGARLSGQPIATQTQLLVPTEGDLLVLRRSDGQPDGRFIPPGKPGKVVSALPYGKFVCMMTAQTWTDIGGGRTYANYAGTVVVWAPKEPDKKPETGGGK